MLKTWCEVRTGKTPGPSEVAEERMRPCRARWAMISIGRLLEKLGPKRYNLPECVEEEFCELRLLRHSTKFSNHADPARKAGGLRRSGLFASYRFGVYF